jgi:cysteine sulfinate desulfinase/cysteine desulfurase-like protein
MLPVLYGYYGNPSSSHQQGLSARLVIEKARGQVSSLLGCSTGEVIFTSGGTESNNAAIKGAAWAHRDHGNHIITSAIEHPAVLEVCEWLVKQGFRVTTLPVDGYGMVNPQDLENALDDSTILVSIMHANNEVGTVQPIRDMARMAHSRGALFHTDAAQSVGKIAVRVADLEVDLLSVAGHKVYAPKGIGVLYIRKSVKLEKFMHGASHEGGRRAGTENVLEIAGLGAACETAGENLAANMAHYYQMRNRLEKGLLERLGSGMARVNGHPEKRLPNTLSLSFYMVEANKLLEKITPWVSASAGAACHAGNVNVSTVLQAMHVPLDWAMGTIRFSTGRGTTTEQIAKAEDIITQAVIELAP